MTSSCLYMEINQCDLNEGKGPALALVLVPFTPAEAACYAYLLPHKWVFRTGQTPHLPVYSLSPHEVQIDLSARHGS